MKTLADLAAPAVVERVLLEKDVQKQCADWARARGYWARKFSSQSQRSVPDYLFAGAHRKGDGKHKCLHADVARGACTCCAYLPHLKFATEFKRPGTKPKLIKKYGVTVMSTEAQYEEQEAMRTAGWDVFECDNFEHFKRQVFEYEKLVISG